MVCWPRSRYPSPRLLEGYYRFSPAFSLLAIGLGLLKAVKETQMQAKTQNEELPHPDAENTDIPTEGGTAL